MTPQTAMVMAAGLGTRMQPLTKTRPKALVEVAGRTLIDHNLDRLASFGVRHAVVNLHTFADMLHAHLQKRCQQGQPPRLHYSDERACLLDTGGGLLKARHLLGADPVFVVNTDALWKENPEGAGLETLTKFWNPDDMGALLLLSGRETSPGYQGTGDFHKEKTGLLRRGETGGRGTAPWVYAGTQILNPNVLDEFF